MTNSIDTALTGHVVTIVLKYSQTGLGREEIQHRLCRNEDLDNHAMTRTWLRDSAIKNGETVTQMRSNVVRYDSSARFRASRGQILRPVTYEHGRSADEALAGVFLLSLVRGKRFVEDIGLRMRVHSDTYGDIRTAHENKVAI